MEKGDGYMRVELETLNVTAKQKFTKNDEKKIISIIKKHQEELIGAWNAHFHQ
ncbi:DUF4160 domain-containing protein [Sulfurospirillum tamanense]|uniref:DUF4160 domain-containing protein n=1 Tax=Sulfurospirillum tamanense TaxID=2813362 RepID=UPI0034E29A60